MLVVSAIVAGLNDAFLLTISFHDPSLSAIIGSSKSLIPYIKDNIERALDLFKKFVTDKYCFALRICFCKHWKFGMEIALDLANFGTKASIVARTRTRATPFSIYKDSVATSEIDPHQPNQSHSWRTLGARADEKKENNTIPDK
ncbi:hypothetical protein ACSQ67_024658 [Phaseolus vulgaris]